MRIGIGSDFLEYIPDYDTRFARLKELGFDAKLLVKPKK